METKPSVVPILTVTALKVEFLEAVGDWYHSTVVEIF
jgi:hypothetical protein